MRRLTLASLLTLLSLSAEAQQLRFNSFAHGGTGCPSNTVAFSPTPDGQSVSVLFDVFNVQVPQHDGSNDNESPGIGRSPRRRNDASIQHRVCHLAFNVELPDGEMVEAIEVSIFNRGATILDPGVRASLHTSYIGHAGMGVNQTGPQNAKLIEKKIWGAQGRFAQEVNEDWTSTPKTAIPVRSGCARQGNRSVRFQLKNQLEVEIMGGDLTKSGLLTMDSSDVNASMKFRVLTRKCGGSLPPGRVVRRVVSR
ncbi:MAG: DUF4360 domain-containing protein [Bacteriovoracia bacterium]